MNLHDLLNQAWAAALVNHLWQSTVVVATAWLLAAALRKNHAPVRYWLWFAASVKFLLPFSLLIAAGAWLRSLIPAPAARPAVATVIDQVTQPFGQMPLFDATTAPIPAHHANPLPAVLFTLWLCGVLLVALRFARAWAKVNAAKRSARPLDLPADVPVFSSSAPIEPGIFGIFRPVLLLPAGILDRLSPDQMRAIVAHEMCHVRRRDNLTYAIHMLVESLFWFHPAAWWIGARLIDERERACDEAVVQAGGEAHVYAEGILNVCKFYLESPLACVSGITGSDLKQRVVNIMTGRALLDMNWPKKMLLAATAVCLVAVPILLGQAKPAQRLMLEAIQPAPKPVQAAARAIVPGIVTPSTEELAALQSNAPPTAAPSPVASATAQPAGIMGSDLLSIADIAAPNADTPAVSFDVSSIKVNKSSSRTRVQEDPPEGDGITLDNLTLFDILGWNFNIRFLREDQLVGVPKWFTTEHFDIQAKVAAADVPAWRKLNDGQRRLVFRKLLVDRFKLAAHWANVEGPIYNLVIAKGGLKIKPVKAGDPDPNAPKNADGKPMTGGGIRLIDRTPSGMKFGFQEASLSLLAKAFLSNYAGRQVYDDTGTPPEAIYDFTLQFAPDRSATVNPGSDSGEASAPLSDSGPSLFTALQEQLGLKLNPAKGPVGRLVIDHVEQPSPN